MGEYLRKVVKILAARAEFFGIQSQAPAKAVWHILKEGAHYDGDRLFRAASAARAVAA